jgi:hypothetical protein
MKSFTSKKNMAGREENPSFRYLKSQFYCRRLMEGLYLSSLFRHALGNGDLGRQAGVVYQ